MRKIIKIKVLFLIKIFILFFCVANLLAAYLLLPGELTERKVLIIAPNSTISQISNYLEDENVITHSSLFAILCQIYSYFEPIKSGEYDFTVKISPFQVIQKLTIGKSIVHRLYIPEGLMISEIIDRINSEDRLSGKIVSKVPEGYLMPSTYFYTYEDKREKLIDIMRKGMSETLDEAMEFLQKNSPLKTRLDVLILASIIEKEAANDKERPRVASVFINRLNKKMKLQADPTTAYAVTKGKYKLDRPLTRSDLRIKSKYNTYHVYGLPPKPIACPGRASIMAAVKPERTNFLYFVVNGRGTHNFAKTLKEHNKNVAEYRSRETVLQNLKKQKKIQVD